MQAFTLLAGTGFVALSLALLFGFEETNRLLFWVAAALLLAAPAVVVGRLVASHTLTRQQKRAWSAYLRRLEP